MSAEGMIKKRQRKSQVWIRITTAVVAVCLFAFGFLAVKMLLSHNGGEQKKVHMVRLIKPPPPPPVIEEKPEPEIEEIKEPEPVETPEKTEDTAREDVAPGDQLGIDADGSGGGDAFGLIGKKGGRSLIGGAHDRNQELMRQYAWYIRIIEDEISKTLVRKGDIPEGEFQTLVDIVLDEHGRIVRHRICRSSGNKQMDDAVSDALDHIRQVEPPPSGMPKSMKIRISSPV